MRIRPVSLYQGEHLLPAGAVNSGTYEYEGIHPEAFSASQEGEFLRNFLGSIFALGSAWNERGAT